MNAAAATDMLLNKAGSDLSYINRMQAYKQKQEQEKQKLLVQAAHSGVGNAVPAGENSAQIRQTGGTGSVQLPQAGCSGADASVRNGQQAQVSAGMSAADQELAVRSNPVYQAVLQGEKNSIVKYADEELVRGTQPEQVINQYLIPAINEVGELFNEQKYFLPQLIASANAMKSAIEYLEPKIQRTGSEAEAAALVIATVEGDIHDIGKNLVVLMLRNYGYHVIDLGKDIPAETIVSTAISEHAAVIGLSALMTTTMMRMQDVVQLAKERNYAGKIIIGGAAITPSFADEIGADGYSKDAAECVKLVKRLLAE